MGAKLPARFSCLYESELDYAEALVRYGGQDGLELTVRNGRLMIGVGSKSGADLLGELRAHEAAVIACLLECSEKNADSTSPAQPAESFRPPIVRVPPFGCDEVPHRFKAPGKRCYLNTRLACG